MQEGRRETMAKRYRVYVSMSQTGYFEVEAEDEEDAREQAAAAKSTDFEEQTGDWTVQDVEEVTD